MQEKQHQLMHQVINWYFDNFDPGISKTSARDPKHSEEMWALLLAKAISSFNQGLEDRVEPDNSRVAHIEELSNDIIDMVGINAFKDISLLVTASGCCRLASVEE